MTDARWMPGFRIEDVEIPPGTPHVPPGLRIRTATRGTGFPVLLLHGHPQTLVTWRHVGPALAEAGYAVVATDLRGYGDSGKPAGASARELQQARHGGGPGGCDARPGASALRRGRA